MTCDGKTMTARGSELPGIEEPLHGTWALEAMGAVWLGMTDDTMADWPMSMGPG